MDTNTTDNTTSNNNDAKLVALNQNLQASAQTAVEVVHKYAALDPSDGNNAWQDPKAIFDELRQCRDALNSNWAQYQAAFAAATDQTETEETKMPDEEFSVLYMDMITDAFGDVLEQMREEEGDKLDVNVLVDCLQSGMEFLDDKDKGMRSYFDSFRMDDDDEEDEESAVPIHELRRLELGFLPVEAET